MRKIARFNLDELYPNSNGDAYTNKANTRRVYTGKAMRKHGKVFHAQVGERIIMEINDANRPRSESFVNDHMKLNPYYT